MNFLKGNWVAIVALIIALFAFFHFLPVKLGGVSTTCSGFTTCLSDLYLNTQGGGSGSLQTVGTATIGGAATFSSSIIQGGVTQTTVRQALVATATTTPCAIAFPTASSTVDSFAVTITTATSSNMYYVVGITTQFATSSSLLSATNVAGSAQGALIAYPSSGVGNLVANPYITLGVTTGSPAYTYTSGVLTGGFCQAIFDSIN
jgi:hypothetical protein